MLTLCIDTAYKYLTLVLMEDDKIIDSISFECFKRQSEEVFVYLDKLFSESKIDKKDIDAMCITKGPGSYTGVRIAMTIAKVLCQVKDIKLYTISTLRLYAGNHEKTMVIMDARANRAYVGVYDKETCLLEDCAMELKDIDTKDYNIVLDGSLVGKEDVAPNIPECFLACKNLFEEVENINHLAPEYLKESTAYYR